MAYHYIYIYLELAAFTGKMTRWWIRSSNWTSPTSITLSRFHDRWPAGSLMRCRWEFQRKMRLLLGNLSLHKIKVFT